MSVTKRDGRTESVDFNKIHRRIKGLMEREPSLSGIDHVRLTQKIIKILHPGITTIELDEEAARLAANMEPIHLDYGELASRISVSNLHKNTDNTFTGMIKQSYALGGISDYLYYVCHKYADQINNEIKPDRDYKHNYMALRTFERLYALKDKNSKVVDRICYMWMRVALALFKHDIIGPKDYQTNYLQIHSKETRKETFKFHQDEDGIEYRQRYIEVSIDDIDWDSIHDSLHTLYGETVKPNFDRVFKLYNYLSNKLCTLATPILFNAGTRTENYVSCFAPETQICTINDGIKNIEDVCIGDLVISHTGNVRKVEQVHKNKLGDRQLFEIKCHNTPSIKVTGNHRLLSITSEQEQWKEKPQWNRVDHLRKGDYIGIPNYEGNKEYEIIDLAKLTNKFVENDAGLKYKYEITDDKITPITEWSYSNGTISTSKHSTINRYITINEEFCKFLGIWYGDGCVYSNKHKNGNSYLRGINIVSHKENKRLINFCAEFIRKTFGYDVKIYGNKGRNKNCVKIEITSAFLANVFKELFGRGCNGKFLYKGAYKWNKELVKNLFIGIVSSDGCFTKQGHVLIQFSNQKFTKELYFLGRHLGITISYTECHKNYHGKFNNPINAIGKLTIPKSFINPKEYFKYYEDDRLSTNKKLYENHMNSNPYKVKIINGVKYVRLDKKIKINDKPEFVYTLGIEKDHSYAVEGIIAENCFLKSLSQDSVKGMYSDVGDIADLFKSAGGVGYHLHDLRAHGSLINSSNGRAEGIVPFARSLNDTSRHIKQGGRRNGSLALYLAIWHADVIDFLYLKKPVGEENSRARDLFYALWIPDLFMDALCKNDWWYLMSPDECPGLSDTYGDEFEKLYNRYVSEGRYRAKMKAQYLWNIIQEIRVESGSPYLLAKDACNLKSNQQNIGTIKSSNLCVTPDTLILTNKGYKQIDKLRNRTITIWNGFEWSEVTVRKTGDNQKIMKITFSNGKYLKCTKYHKFHLNTKKIVEAKDLCIDNLLMEHKWPDGTNAKSISIIKIEDLEERSDTYCFNEPINHSGIFNGIIAGNCSEILLYSSPEETADCVLCSVAVNAMVRPNTVSKLEFDFELFGNVVELMTEALNCVIDNNNYTNLKTKISNERHRPIGIGVQGLADLFIQLRLPFDSVEASVINKQVFETMYYHALQSSVNLSKLYGPYSTFKGSPTSEGRLQFDLWGINIADYTTRPELDWERLRADIITHGLRNSTLIALMPTATTSIILGNSSCFEPIISNVYKKKTLAGEFTVLNKFLVRDLMKIGLWNDDIYQSIKAMDGSIQHLTIIPKELRDLYKIVWEMKQKTIVDLCVDRGPFVCQSQSMNLFFSDPDADKMIKAAIYAWKKGLKTLCYYTRVRTASGAIKYTVDSSVKKVEKVEKEETKSDTEESKPSGMVCTDEVCIMCQG